MAAHIPFRACDGRNKHILRRWRQTRICLTRVRFARRASAREENMSNALAQEGCWLKQGMCNMSNKRKYRGGEMVRMPGLRAACECCAYSGSAPSMSAWSPLQYLRRAGNGGAPGWCDRVVQNSARPVICLQSYLRRTPLDGRFASGSARGIAKCASARKEAFASA